MKYLWDFIAILLMGDGLAKILSPMAHNRFYQFPWAPRAYNELLERQTTTPWPGIVLGVLMMIVGANLSRHVEHQI
jgi:hypothetical protein